MSFHQKGEYSLDLPICVLLFYFILFFSTLKIILIKYINHCGIFSYTYTIITLSLFSLVFVVVLTVVMMSGFSYG